MRLSSLNRENLKVWTLSEYFFYLSILPLSCLSAGPYVKKMSRLPILAKSNFLFQWDFGVPKLKKIEGGKILTPPTPQNVTSSFLRSVKNLFRNILIFLLLIERSHWVEEKVIKSYDLKIFCSGNISPQKMYKILASNLWTTVRNLYI